MALHFDTLTDKVVVTQAASINDLDPLTILVWTAKTTVASSDRLWNKHASSTSRNIVRTTSTTALKFNIEQVTTNCEYDTSDAIFDTVGKWVFVAFVYDGGATPRMHIYHGSLTALAAEASYAAEADGAGARTSDSADLHIGTNRTAEGGWEGDIAIFQIEGRAMTLAECQNWQFRPRVLADTRLFLHLGFNGTGTQPDWSGNGNSGAGTAVSVVDHVPLGPPFGFDLGWQGNFGAVAAAASLLPPPRGMQHMLVR